LSASLKLENAPERLPGETLQQWVLRRLRRAILTGRIPPGRAVTIRGLAEQLGVSATPVREALRTLASEHALDLLDNRRVRVPDMTLDRFEELLYARISLETEAAERAMFSIDDNRLAELVALDEAIGVAIDASDIEAWIEANFAFHACLYQARPSPVLMPLIESLWLQIGPFMRYALESLDDRYAVDRHGEALDAIRARNRMALRLAIESDIRDGIGHLGVTVLRRLAGGDLAPPAGGRYKM